VPAGIYAREALTALGLWDGVADHLAQTDNVLAALALVAAGEAPLGIVYRTDALVEPGVSVVAAFPGDSHAAILYPVALTAEHAHPDAGAFLDFLCSETAREVFEVDGFTWQGDR
jgi:molybdate transport system substrate-binding protein